MISWLVSPNDASLDVDCQEISGLEKVRLLK